MKVSQLLRKENSYVVEDAYSRKEIRIDQGIPWWSAACSTGSESYKHFAATAFIFMARSAQIFHPIRPHPEWKIYLRTLTAVFWTGVNTVAYYRKTLGKTKSTS